MSAKLRSSQYRDSRGSVVDGFHPNLALLAAGAGAPTASAAGYEPGCIYINTSGSAGSLLYVNRGTSSSATWQNVV